MLMEGAEVSLCRKSVPFYVNVVLWGVSGCVVSLLPCFLLPRSRRKHKTALYCTEGKHTVDLLAFSVSHDVLSMKCFIFLVRFPCLAHIEQRTGVISICELSQHRNTIPDSLFSFMKYLRAFKSHSKYQYPNNQKKKEQKKTKKNNLTSQQQQKTYNPPPST